MAQTKVQLTEKEFKALRSALSFYEQTVRISSYKEAFVRDLFNENVSLPEHTEKHLKRLTFDEVISIVYMDNYEILASPEDRLRDYYKEKATSKASFDKSRAQVVVDVLTILDIKVEGINSHRLDPNRFCMG